MNGAMYIVTAYQSLAAIDPETGKKLWEFSHKHAGRPPRGIAYWPGDSQNPPELLFGTFDGFLIAVNARTGKAVAGFGKEGEIDLKTGMKDKFPEVHYGLSGAPVNYRNIAITGSQTQDSPGLGSKGDLRAWDVRTGKLNGPFTPSRGRAKRATKPGWTTAGRTVRG